MKDYNLVAVIDPTATQMLFCLRRKPPYAGLYNFVGGKKEPGESGLDAAYRELAEETGIARQDIDLQALMILTYPMEDTRMEVYAGRLRRSVNARGSENDLVWLPVAQDYRDETRFAGVGNLGHIAQYLRKYTSLLDPTPPPADEPRPTRR